MLLRCLAPLLIVVLGLPDASAAGVHPWKLNPTHPLRSLLRLQFPRDPEARAILHEIENGPRELAMERVAARRDGIPLTPAELQAPMPPAALNAAPVYEQLMRLLREKPLDPKVDQMALWMGVQFTQSPAELASLRKLLLVDRHDVMDLIHQAADRPYCVFHRRWKLGLTVILFPEHAAMRLAARLLRAESYLLAREGRFDEAIAEQARGFRIAQDAASEPTIIPPLVGIDCDALALAGMKDVLYLAGSNAEVADNVRAVTAARRPTYSLRRAFGGELVVHLEFMEMLRREGPKGLAETLSDKPVPQVRKTTPRQRELLRKFWDAAEAEYLRQMRRAIELADRPDPVRLAQLKQLDQEFTRRYIGAVNDPVRRVLAFSLFPVLAPTASNFALARARQGVVIAGAAVLAYHASHQAWPGHLEEALSMPPQDPFSGRPLEYRTEGDGFIVYSVGPGGRFAGHPPAAGTRAAPPSFRYPAPAPRPHPPLETEPAASPWPPLHLSKPDVNAVAFSPNGQWIVSGGGEWRAGGDDDLKLKLWDVRSGKLLWARTAQCPWVLSVAFSPNGRWIASASGNQTIWLYDAQTGTLQRTLPGHEYGAVSLAFSPDSRRLASAGTDAAKIWDVRTGRLLRTFSRQSIWDKRGRSVALDSVAFSPDGRLLAAGSHDFTIKLRNVRTGRPWRTLTGHTGWVNSVAFAPGGRRLASGSSDGTIKLWSLATGKPLWTTPASADDVNSVAFSPDGKWLVSGQYSDPRRPSDSVKLWDARTGHLVRGFVSSRSTANSVAFSPNGPLIAAGCNDGTVKLWEVRTGKLLRTFPRAAEPRGCCSPAREESAAERPLGQRQSPPPALRPPNPGRRVSSRTDRPLKGGAMGSAATHAAIVVE